jgi:hypothetical protein
MVLPVWLEIEVQLPSTPALIEEIGSGHLENFSGQGGKLKLKGIQLFFRNV